MPSQLGAGSITDPFQQLDKIPNDMTMEEAQQHTEHVSNAVDDLIGAHPKERFLTSHVYSPLLTKMFVSSHVVVSFVS